MFDQIYENRLESWANFRDSLEEADDPFRKVLENYNLSPYVRINLDPWDSNTWPSPWELILENTYDDFSRVLGMCYSLQLTDRFKESSFEIHIISNSEKGHCFLLLVDQILLGYIDDEIIIANEIPKNFYSQQIYPMPSLQ